MRNVAEVVRFGGLETGEAPSPFAVEVEHHNYRLRRYFADEVPDGAVPILLIPPLMLTTEVWDVSPRASAVGALHEDGLDTWVVDFGHPDRDPGGLERDLTDHVLAVSEAIDVVREKTGRDVILAGYSQGGMFAYQTAAFRRNKGIDSLVTFGSPVDASAPLPIPLSPEAASRLAATLIDSGLFRKLAVPGWFSRTGFKLLTPAKSVQDRIKFLLTLHDRDALLPRERQRRFLESEGWTAWSGPAVVQFLEMYFQHNRMLEGGFVIDERLVTLADIDLPVLTVVGSTDTIGHPDAVRAVRRAAPSADIYELTLRAGHFGLVVGSTAMSYTWPAVGAWARWRDGAGQLPDSIVPAEQVQTSALRPSGGGAPGVFVQASELGVGASRLALSTARRAARLARSVVSEAPAQLPRLQRIEQLDPSTRISIGSLLDEQARRNADEICFLFGDRAYRQREVKHRVDSIVKGLIEIGVQQGDTVGVLMSTRPSAFTVIAALSRLGATAAVLRPDGDLGREARLARIDRVITDPEHADAVSGSTTVRCYVLGGGADERELPADADRHGAHRPRRGRGAVVVPRQPAPRRRRRVRPVHRRGHRHEGDPDQQQALGPVGARHGERGGAACRRHRLQRHAAAPLVRAADVDRRCRRRRCAVRDVARRRRRHVLGRGAALRRDPRQLHLDVAARASSTRRSTRTSGSTRSGCSSAPACRATCGSGSASGSATRRCSSSTHRPRARRSSPT